MWKQHKDKILKHVFSQNQKLQKYELRKSQMQKAAQLTVLQNKNKQLLEQAVDKKEEVQHPIILSL